MQSEKKQKWDILKKKMMNGSEFGNAAEMK